MLVNITNDNKIIFSLEGMNEQTKGFITISWQLVTTPNGGSLIFVNAAMSDLKRIAWAWD
jgi:hypothetical protein